MSLFKRAQDKTTDLLEILIPSITFEVKDEIRRRIAKEMEGIVQDAAQRVIGYGYKDVIKELTVKVDSPRRQWTGLAEEEIVGCTCECVDDGTFNMECAVDFARAIEAKLKERNA